MADRLTMQTGAYPENWKEIAEAIKREVNYVCEWCDTQCEKLNANGKQMSVHHLDGNPQNCERSNLAALCSRCHLSDQHRVFRLLRRKRLEDAGQLQLFQG